jgi:hypothetical protein
VFVTVRENGMVGGEGEARVGRHVTVHVCVTVELFSSLHNVAVQ